MLQRVIAALQMDVILSESDDVVPPLLFPSKKFDFREAGLHIFPFLIIYLMRGETIRILDVFHTSQNSDKKP